MKTEPGVIIQDGKEIAFDDYLKEIYAREHLESILENGSVCLCIYPEGKTSPVGGRVVAEGFIFPEGFFFIELGWNSPDYCGFGCAHLVDGDVSEVQISRDDFWEVSWNIGEYGGLLVVDTIHDEVFQKYRKMMNSGVKDDRNRNREYVRKMGQEYVAGFVPPPKKRQE